MTGRRIRSRLFVTLLISGILWRLVDASFTDTIDDIYSNFTCKLWECNNEPSFAGNNYMYYFLYKGCFCDYLCGFYADCCPDAQNVTTAFVDKSLKTHMRCIRNCRVSTRTRFSAVAGCPEGFSDQHVVEMCTSGNTSDIFLQIPVTGVSSGLLYNNAFCARCHEEEEAVIWQLRITCLGEDARAINASLTFRDILEIDGCIVEFVPPFNTTDFRPCFGDLIDSCPNGTRQDVKDRCEGSAAFQLVHGHGRVYRNPSCGLCNQHISPKCGGTWEDLTCPVPGWTDIDSFYSMSLLFDINSGQGTKTVTDYFEDTDSEFSKAVPCSAGEIYDPFSDVCRVVTCGKAMVLVNGTCVYKQEPPGFHPVSGTANVIEICRWITLNSSLFFILPDGSVQAVSETLHNQTDLVFGNASDYKCSNTTRNVETTDELMVIYVPRFSSVEGTVSGVLMIISLLALVLTSAVYIAFKTLRNVAGLNILSVCIALFLAYLVMLIAPSFEDIPLVCKIFGIGIHYFFLVAFFWMNVTAISIWNTFRKGLRRNNQRRKLHVTCMKHSLYAWTMALVPVLCAITVDHIKPASAFSPGYGQGICWMRNKLAILVFFAGPLAVIVLTNVVLFTWTAVMICKVKRSTPRGIGREQKDELLIYMKLFLVMGLTWALGFLSAAVPHPVITYAYIVINSLQGLFIGISFICTRTVFRLFRDCLCESGKTTTADINNHSTCTDTHL